jgi:hypothetical protein
MPSFFVKRLRGGLHFGNGNAVSDNGSNV